MDNFLIVARALHFASAIALCGSFAFIYLDDLFPRSIGRPISEW
jgi:cytochrome b561